MPGEKMESASVDQDHSDSALKGVAVRGSGCPDRSSARPAAYSTKGVVVTNVDPASPAAAAGLQEGDVIQEVNRKPVTNSQDFAQAVHRSNGESLLLVNRQGNKLFLAV